MTEAHHLKSKNPDSGPLEAVTVIVMAKPATPGRVKTRLVGGQPGKHSSELSAEQAAQVHAAMLACVLERLANWLPGPKVLAVDGWGTEPSPGLGADVPAGWTVMGQGKGDLGARLAHVWQTIGGGPAAFFGVDSPDVPAEALQTLGPALQRAEAAVGPTADGGYWTLAARTLQPALLHAIDWGTASVYHQTQQAAMLAGVSLEALRPWHDVDEPADLNALRDRLAEATNAPEPALQRLRQRLTQILPPRR